MPPKVFVSYSWTNEEFKRLIVEWCELLCQDGIDVILDRWALKEGADKYAFMERMVRDESVNKVLIFSDATYQEKADSKSGGVGTETQIISADIYGKVSQNKFIPIVCQYAPDGKPCLPIFLRNLMFIDFSTPEKVNSGWEKLLRAIYNKPWLKKPELGKTPSYILELEHRPILTRAKFESFKTTLLNNRPILNMTRKDYSDAVKAALDQFHITVEKGDDRSLDEKVLSALEEMLVYRDELVEYFYLNLSAFPGEKIVWDHICELFNNLLELKFRPRNSTSFDEEWSDNYGFFLHELCIYLVAVAISLSCFDFLSYFFDYGFILPEHVGRLDNPIIDFKVFYNYSKSLRLWNDKQEHKFCSPGGEWIRRRATNPRISFSNVQEAEYVVFLRIVLHTQHGRQWFPPTLVYREHYHMFPIIAKSTKKSFFPNFCRLLGVSNKAMLIEKIVEVDGRCGSARWGPLRWERLIEALNLNKLDTV